MQGARARNRHIHTRVLARHGGGATAADHVRVGAVGVGAMTRGGGSLWFPRYYPVLVFLRGAPSPSTRTSSLSPAPVLTGI